MMMSNLRGAMARRSSGSAVRPGCATWSPGGGEGEGEGGEVGNLRHRPPPASPPPPHLAYHSGPRQRRALHVHGRSDGTCLGARSPATSASASDLSRQQAAPAAVAGGMWSGRRGFARSSAPPASCETPEDKARTVVISAGHSPRIARGVVDALASSGLSGEALLSTVRTMAGRIEVGEDAGLDALVASVEQELARSEGKKEVKFICVPPSAWNSREPDYDAEEGEEGECDESEEEVQKMMDASFEVRGYEGMSITDVAKFGTLENADVLGEHLECACSGVMACSTCHVVVSPRWFDCVGEPSEAEQDMIDLAYNPKRTSRLGCQVVLKKELDGLVIKLPRGANNMMDHIPFEDDKYC